jgi:hypothetical protein
VMRSGARGGWSSRLGMSASSSTACQNQRVVALPDPRRSLRYRILNFAFDEAAVWAITNTVTVYPRTGAPFEAWPSATADELRPELETLLRERKVELVPYGGRGAALALEDALEETNRDEALLPPLESGRNGFEVVLTPAGEAEGEAIANATPDRRPTTKPNMPST